MAFQLQKTARRDRLATGRPGVLTCITVRATDPARSIGVDIHHGQGATSGLSPLLPRRAAGHHP
jgi:hypothetical protein